MGTTPVIVQEQLPFYDTTPVPKSCSPYWMARLRDSIPLSAISIPGTHSTLALHGGAATQCQAWSLSQQLEAGIRFLDVRCRHYRNKLYIYHRHVSQKFDLHSVILECEEFLKEHPSETILMRIKREHTEEKNSVSMDYIVRDYIESRGGTCAFWMSSNIPVLSQVRGKIVIIYDYEEATLGINYWALNVADEWDVSGPLHVDRKWHQVKCHLEKATEGDYNMFITQCSASSPHDCSYPHYVAQYINEMVYDMLSETQQCWGVVITDFPGAELIQAIVQTNFDEDEMPEDLLTAE
ncbi:1-phosphatidylinositol phosphodiesterase-like [Saccoglossus kowalevskii]|uniref:Uncharacterized protein LOC100378443 n=1 Tax=Saccoglossus kowalevskii TaxID=10224 RepID=A0ABM0GY75_SACKO|nr:PREDICTED: uncharacterized protein LOC100378443 [Saccoglossus kowalevskii]